MERDDPWKFDIAGHLIIFFKLGNAHNHIDTKIYKSSNNNSPTKKRTFYQNFLNSQDEYPSRLMKRNSRTDVRMKDILTTGARMKDFLTTDARMKDILTTDAKMRDISKAYKKMKDILTTDVRMKDILRANRLKVEAIFLEQIRSLDAKGQDY